MIRVSQFFKQYKCITAAVVLLMFVQTLGTLYIPTLMSDIVNNGIINNDLPYIYRTGGMMMVTALATAAVSVLGALLASKVSARWGRDIRTELFGRIQEFSVRDFNRYGAASMITRSTNDVAQLQDALLMFLQLVLPAPLITIGGLVLAFSKDPVMAVLIVITLTVFIIAALVLSKKAIPLYTRLRIGMDEINRTLRERITGVRVIRAFNREGFEEGRTDKTFSSYSETAIRVNKIFAVLMPIVLTVINLCTLGIIWFGGKRVTAGFMQIGDIMALVEYALLIFWNLVMGVMLMMMFPRAMTSAARINEVLSTEPEITDGLCKFPTQEISVPAMEFRDVTFGYDHAEEAVLSKISFSCMTGQTTAIIGGTGSGKSTIASLMMRFYDIQGGSILVDGKDIREVSQEALRDKIGFVPQKAFLFSGTIAENLRYGNRDASDEEVKAAAKIAQAANFIEESEKGYLSYVSQGGTNFSGGQRQRLCIARALVKKANIFIFDDSFSALDFKTDAMLRAAIKREIHGAAIVVVAQRVSSIIDADQIVVLDNGGITAIGNHDELMKTCEIYREIVRSQRKEDALS